MHHSLDRQRTYQAGFNLAFDWQLDAIGLTVFGYVLVPSLLCCGTRRSCLGFRKWRFSLRTLLIATTLVAVGLGLIVWMTRAG